MSTRAPATFADLARTPGKAELVNGELVHMAPTGDAPGTAGDEIYFSLRKHVEATSAGHAVGDNKAFRVTSRTARRSALTRPITPAPGPE